MPLENQNNYFSGTKCQIHHTPGCIFKCVRCLEIHLIRKFINLDHEGTLEGPFNNGYSEVSLAGSIGGSVWEPMMVPEGPLVHNVVVQECPKKC